MTARLDPIATDLWGAEHDLFMNGLVHFRGRMTVVRLRSGGLLLHSVIPIDDGLAKELEALGPVEHIVAPNLLHHVHVKDAAARYPNAKLWGVPGLAKKRDDVSFDAQLGEDEVPWGDDLQMVMLQGSPWVNEAVFWHDATRTLIVTDLVFNIHEPKGFWAPLVLRMAGAYKRFSQSRLLRFMTRDRDAASQSVAEILRWPIERVVMAHGHIVEDDAKARLATALTWMRGQQALAASH